VPVRGQSRTESAENRELRKRVRLLEQGNEVLRRAVAYRSQGGRAEKRLDPLVGELAAAGTRVTATCRVLDLARQSYSRSLVDPVTDSEGPRRIE